ncbi:MAG: hypothetical protein ACP5JH_08510 [Bacteroidota bacterium]
MLFGKFCALLAVLVITRTAFTQQTIPGFSGLMFGDYYYNFRSSNQSFKNMHGFQYRRIYLTADYDVAKNFTARFRLESDPSTSNLGNGKLSVTMKDAYLDWKEPYPGCNIVIGLQGTWSINTAEEIFGYRSLEKTIQDLHGISDPRSLGVSLTQKFSDVLAASLLIGNPPKAEPNKYKRAYVMLRFKPASDFDLVVDGDYSGVPEKKNIKTAEIIANYGNKVVSLGVQAYMQTIDSGQVDGTTLTSYGISLNGWVSLIEGLRLVARYDSWDADAKTRDDAQDLIIAALDFAARKNVHFIPNIEIVMYENSALKVDVTVRATVYFTF